MFLVWFDPDKRRAIHHKVNDAIAVYREKFTDEPVRVLVNDADAEVLTSRAGEVPLPIEGVHYVAPNTFYVGDYDVPAELDAPAAA